jgi:hypothetical protein
MADNYVLSAKICLNTVLRFIRYIFKNHTRTYAEYKVNKNNVREILQGNIQLVIQCVSQMRKRPFKGTSGATFLRHYRALRR